VSPGRIGPLPEARTTLEICGALPVKALLLV
jgi:hypothetical protein